MTSDPCDLLLRELWINEIFLKHIHVVSPVIICLDTIALSMVCKWFAKELWMHITACQRGSSHRIYSEVSLLHYMQSNCTSTLEFLLYFKWPVTTYNTGMYIELARECFARRATDTFFAIARRTGFFHMHVLAYARTAGDMERFMALSEGRCKQGKLDISDLFVLLGRIQWTPPILKWLVCFVELFLCDESDMCNVIAYSTVSMYLRMIIECRSSLQQCADYMNVIWYGWRNRSLLTDRHFRVKHSVTMALNMNCPALVDYFIFDWPPASFNKNRQPTSHKERLHILFGSTATEKLIELTQGAPASQTWLRDVGFNVCDARFNV